MHRVRHFRSIGHQMTFIPDSEKRLEMLTNDRFFLFNVFIWGNWHIDPFRPSEMPLSFLVRSRKVTPCNRFRRHRLANHRSSGRRRQGEILFDFLAKPLKLFPSKITLSFFRDDDVNDYVTGWLQCCLSIFPHTWNKNMLWSLKSEQRYHH